MVFFAVAIKVLIFGLCAGAVIGVLIGIPLAIYIAPYALWVGNQNLVGKHKDKLQKKEPLKKTVRDATILYKAKLTGKEPIF